MSAPTTATVAGPGRPGLARRLVAACRAACGRRRHHVALRFTLRAAADDPDRAGRAILQALMTLIWRLQEAAGDDASPVTPGLVWVTPDGTRRALLHVELRRRYGWWHGIVTAWRYGVYVPLSPLAERASWVLEHQIALRDVIPLRA